MITREEAKEMFRNDKDSFGKPKGIMGKIDMIYDSIGCIYFFTHIDSKEDFACISNCVDEARKILIKRLGVNSDNLAYKSSHEII